MSQDDVEDTTPETATPEVPVATQDKPEAGPSEPLPLPAYAVDAGPENGAFATISNDLFYRDRDARQVRIFQALCHYAQNRHDARIKIPLALRWMLTKGNAGITVELTLHHALLETIRLLTTGGYALAENGPDGEPLVLELLDPMEGKIGEFLRDQYGAVDGQAVNPQKILKTGSYPTMTAVMAKFNVPAEQAGRLFLSLDQGSFSEDALARHGGRLIQVLFHEGYAKPFDLVLPPGLHFRSVFRQAVGMLKEFHDAHNRFSEEVKQRLKAVPDMNLVSLDQVFQGLLAPGEVIPEQKFIHWAHTLKNFTLSPDFRVHAERYVNPEDGGAPLEGGRFAWVGQAAALVHHALLNGRENLKQKQWEKEAETADAKLILHHLIENCHHDVPMGNSVEKVYYPVGIDQIAAAKDSSGQLTLKDKYGEKRLMGLLRTESTDAVPPVIRLLVDEKPLYLHRFRLIDIFHAECAAETNRVVPRLAKKWARLPPGKMPTAHNYEVTVNDLSPLFREILTYTYHVIDAYPTSQEAVKILFPMPGDISAFKLAKSDLVVVEGKGNRASPQERCQFFKEILYTSPWSVTRRPLKEVLGLDWDALMAATKHARKAMGKSGGGDGVDLGRFVQVVVDFLNRSAKWISSIFGGGSALLDGEENLVKAKATAAQVKEMAPAKRGLTLSQAADRFGVPESRVELKHRIGAALKEWNQVFIDPKSYYPDWNKLRPDEKEKYRKKLEGEVKARMVQAQEKVDRAIEKAFLHMDLEDMPPGKLQEVSNDLAKQFRQNNLTPLANYIRDSIIYMNTTG